LRASRLREIAELQVKNTGLLTNNFGDRKNRKSIENVVVLIFQINSFSFTGKSRVLEF
jgi:hypothetical protein